MKANEDSSDAESDINAAFQAWEDVEYCYLEFVYDGLTSSLPEPSNEDGVNTVYWSPMGTSAAGYTHLNADTEADTVEECDIELSYEDGSSGQITWTGGTPDANNISVQEVMTHEIGHFVGLDDLTGDADSTKTMYKQIRYSDTFHMSLAYAENSFCQYMYHEYNPKPATYPALVPGAVALVQNYPNPFNPETVIRFHLAEPSRVSITIYNSLGQLVRALTRDAMSQPGDYQVRWDGLSDDGEPAASGVYVIRVETGGHVAAGKMTLLR